MKQVGNRLLTLRHSLSLSQAKLADLLGITQSSLNRYENGQSPRQLSCFASMQTSLMFLWIISLPAVTNHKERCITISQKYGKMLRRWSSLWKCALTRNRLTTTA